MAITMKPNILEWCEGRRDLIRTGNDTPLKRKSVPESRNNRCNASNHHRSGVGEVGMLRSEIEISREILMEAKSYKKLKATSTTSCKHSKGELIYEEVGMVHSSVEVPVMGHRAKEPYLVDVNREKKDM